MKTGTNIIAKKFSEIPIDEIQGLVQLLFPDIEKITVENPGKTSYSIIGTSEWSYINTQGVCVTETLIEHLRCEHNRICRDGYTLGINKQIQYQQELFNRGYFADYLFDEPKVTSC